MGAGVAVREAKALPYDVITLDPEAGLGTFLDRLEAARSDRVVVFLPRQLVEFRDPLTLRRVRRRAEALRRDLTLVCEDLRTRLLARREGLRAVGSARQLPRSIRRAARQPGAPPLFVFPRRGLPALLAPIPAGLIGAAVAIALYTLVPGATIRLRPIDRSFDETILIEAASEAARVGGASIASVGAPSGRIPARVVVQTFPVVERIEPSGQRREPVTAATGQVLLLNRTAEAQAIPRDSLVVVPGGPAFLTAAPVELPAAQWSAARVGIVARDLGPAGNVPARRIDRFADPALNARATVVNEQPTAGGAEGDRLFVTPEDYVDLKNRLAGSIGAAAAAALGRARTADESIYPTTIRTQTLDETFSHAIGQSAATLVLTTTVTARAPAFTGADVQEVARRLLADRAGAGLAIVPGSLATRPLDAIDWDDARVRFRVAARAAARTTIDPPTILNLVAGRAPDEAADRIAAAVPLATRPEIDLFPWWQATVPVFDWRVRIES